MQGNKKLDAASVPHDKCRENYAATYVTRQKDHGIKCAANIENFTRQKEKGRRKAPSRKKCDAAIKKTEKN